MKKILRADQQKTIQELQSLIDQGSRRIVIQAPTGYGKTVLGVALAEYELQKAKNVLWTVPAIALVDQTVEMILAHGIEDVGVMQAYHEMTDWRSPMQVASVQTLMRRKMPDAKFAIVDECHRRSKLYNSWFFDPAWKDIPIVGLSATPWAKGMGLYYTDLIIAGTTQEMIDAGTLSDFKVFAPSHPDLRGVRTLAHDYHKADLSKAMSKAILVANIVETWHKLGQNRPTLCFAVDCAHAKMLQEQFEASGVKSAYQDAYTDDLERRSIKRRFHSGEISVVCNVGTLTTGVDWDVRCIIFARPTKSEILFVQIAGRGLRVAEGKDYCLFLDHSDNHLRLGFVTDIKHEKLNNGKEPIQDKPEAGRLPKECPKCAYVMAPSITTCPSCGFTRKAQPKVEVRTGNLKELVRTQAPITYKNPEVFSDRKSIHAQLLWFAHQKNYNPGWAAHKYKELYGDWPPRDKPPMQAASFDVTKWLKSRQIAWAHSKRREEAGQPAGTLTPREQAFIDAVRNKYVPSTMMTEEDEAELTKGLR